MNYRKQLKHMTLSPGCCLGVCAGRTDLGQMMTARDGKWIWSILVVSGIVTVVHFTNTFTYVETGNKGKLYKHNYVKPQHFRETSPWFADWRVKSPVSPAFDAHAYDTYVHKICNTKTVGYTKSLENILYLSSHNTLSSSSSFGMALFAESRPCIFTLFWLHPKVIWQ